MLSGRACRERQPRRLSVVNFLKPSNEKTSGRELKAIFSDKSRVLPLLS